MTDTNTSHNCSCPCGETTFQVNAAPKVRFFCHCSICQKLYNKAFADVTVLSWSHVQLPEQHNIKFDKYRSFPAIDRGTCGSCDKPVMASAGSGDKRIAFISAANYSESVILPPAKMHIFYDRRKEAVLDDLPKHSGYLRSQFAAMRLMSKNMSA
ncbi:MAG: GFA family protein [Pseudomonadales bacterium]